MTLTITNDDAVPTFVLAGTMSGLEGTGRLFPGPAIYPTDLRTRASGTTSRS